jgi:hypothetical protein
MTSMNALRAGLVSAALLFGTGAWAQDTEGAASVPAATETVATPDQAAAEMAADMTAVGGAAAAAAGGLLMTIVLVSLLPGLLIIASLWVIFSKAGLPGWGSLIPIYNIFLLLKAAGKPAWWLAVILLVPVVNIVFLILAIAGLAKNFGKGGGFAAGLILLPIIFFPVLAFGKAQHVAGGAGATSTPDQDAMPTVARRPAGPVTVVSAGNLTIFSVLALVAFLCITALIVLQYMEISFFSADPSVWPPGS